MKKTLYTILGFLLSVPFAVSALNITVPSAPGRGYWLTSTSTGAWIASSTDPMIIGSLIATTTNPSSFMGYLGVGTASPAYKLDVAGNVNVSAGSAYMYNGANVITASTTLNNYFFGNSGNLTMTGAYNTASGVQALLSNTTGYYNTASGMSALLFNTTGYQNTASGMSTLRYNTTGFNNTASGMSALFSNTTGFNNTASGVNALRYNTTGYHNTTSGVNSLRYNTTGYQNTASGMSALFSNTTGSFNLANGYQAGYGDGTPDQQSTIDNYATFLGYQASRDASVASTTPLTNITAIGKNARVGASNTIVLGGTGADAVNVGIGTVSPAYKLDVAGNINVSAGSAYMYNGANVITASTTLNNYFFGNSGNLTMTGAYNTASGVGALLYNTTGNYNTASGVSALLSNTTGYSNTASGMSALQSNTTGNSNTASGVSSLRYNTTGYQNTASGVNSLYSNTTGYYNTASGKNSLYSNTTGLGLTSLGFQAGYGDGTANQRSVIDNYATFLGFQASRDASVASTTPLTNITAIGKNAHVGASNTIVLGGTGADAVNVGIGTVSPTATLDVNGTMKTKGYTVATLPTGSTIGTRAYVTDALAPTFLGVLVGGGAVVSPAFFNGSAWVAE